MVPTKLTDEQRQAAITEHPPIEEVLIIQGSPRGARGRTNECLEWFTEGIRQAGAEVEVVFLHKLKINHCIGCFGCWMKHPGVCVHKDDMPALLKKMAQAETVVFAPPLYTYSVPGLFKDFLDRCLPLIEPWLVPTPDGRTTHPSRYPQKQRAVTFSVCGFPETDHFQPLLDMFRRMNHTLDSVLVGELLRPAAESLVNGDKLGPVVGRIKAAFHQAGRELVEQGYISNSTEEAVAEPIFTDVDSFRMVGNTFWEVAMEFFQAKSDGKVQGDLQDWVAASPRMGLAGMTSVFNPQAAGDLEAVIMFDLEGEPGGRYHLNIADGRCAFREGGHDSPDLTITTPWSVWQEVSDGRLDGQQAVMEGKYKVNGDLALLMRFKELFGGN